MPQGKKDDETKTESKTESTTESKGKSKSGNGESGSQPKTGSPKASWPTYPVRVDNSNARSDKDAYEGGRVKVVSGDHEGSKGVFASVAEYDESDGYPKSILVNFTDKAYKAANAVVDYSDVVPANYVDLEDDAVKYQEEEREARTLQMVPDEPAEQLAGDTSSEGGASRSGVERRELTAGKRDDDD